MAAFAAAVVVLVALSLPPAQLALDAPFIDGTVPGIIHVHTKRSDGRGTVEEVAAVAARVGLKFVVFTDHGDGTRAPEPPQYRSGVLCLDGVEISTAGGHYLALDMPAAPYPLGGEARDVVEDVKRLGGFGIVAHPESPKPELRWSAWESPFDGIEWVNPDSSWRVHLQRGWRSRLSVIEALMAYPVRSEEAVARLLGGTTLRMDRWNALTRTRKVVALSGVDAHASLSLGSGDRFEGGFSLPIPSYEASLRTLSAHAQIERPLTGDAISDATAIFEALRRGHVYTAIDGLATQPAFQFTATHSRQKAEQGDTIDAAEPVTLLVKSNAPPAFTTSIWRDDIIVNSAPNQRELRQIVDKPGVYRVEIDAPSSEGPLPWIVSNPIYLGMTYHPAEPERKRPVAASQPLFDGSTLSGWWTESDATSKVTVDVASTATGATLRVRFALATGPSSSQYAGLAAKVPSGVSYDRVKLAVSADRVMRMSVQLRAGSSAPRWRRSVYVDQVEREHTIYFDHMTPVGETPSPHPPPNSAGDVLLVVDTLNVQPGSSGTLWFKSVTLQQ
jgi:hypothetical protein